MGAVAPMLAETSIMMLDTLPSTQFAARAGKELVVETAQGDFALEILSVKENPLAAGPNSKRTPFSVLLHGPDTPCLADDCYALRIDDEALRLEGIYLNRIIPPANTDGCGAFYQVIFG
jgi:hypothetical protein